MSETEIALAQAYLSASGQDPVAALIRSVRDLAKVRRLLASRTDRLTCAPREQQGILGPRPAERP